MSDITYRDEGTVVLFTILSDAAWEFVREHVHVEDWQFLGSRGFAADRRPAWDLIGVFKREGFTVEELR